MDPGEHGLQSGETASDGGDSLKSKRSGRNKAKRADFEESNWVSSPRLRGGVIASRPASKKSREPNSSPGGHPAERYDKSDGLLESATGINFMSALGELIQLKSTVDSR